MDGEPSPFSNHVNQSFINEKPKQTRQYSNDDFNDIDPFSELSQLMFDNDYDSFVKIIEAQPKVINKTDCANNTLLIMSSFWGKLEFCKFLLSKKCDANIRNVTDMNALDIALQWGRPDIAQVLVEANGETGVFTRIKGLEDIIKFRKYIYTCYFKRLENIRESLEGNLSNMKHKNIVLTSQVEKLKNELKFMTAERKKFEKKSIEYITKSELLEKQLQQAMENNSKLRNHNYKLKDEAFSLNKSLKKELTSNSELRITIMTLNAWLDKLKKTAQYLNLQTMLHKEKEKEALLLKEKANRQMKIALKNNKRLQNIDKRCDYLEKKLARKDTFTAMDAVNRLVPPSILRDAMKGLQKVSEQRLKIDAQEFRLKQREQKQEQNHVINTGEQRGQITLSAPIRSSWRHGDDGSAITEQQQGELSTVKDKKYTNHVFNRPVFSRAMGGVSVPFDLLLVSPSGTGMSMVTCTDVQRDDDGLAEQLTVEYRTEAWKINEPKSTLDYSEAKAINDFLEVDEILGSVVVRRHIQPKIARVFGDSSSPSTLSLLPSVHYRKK
jgi:ankyrin repeat protein